MATPNGFLDSEDELFVDGGTEDLQPFIFQSDLSDDEAPGSLALNEIASVTIAAMNGPLGLGSSSKDDEDNKDLGSAIKHDGANGTPTKGAREALADKPRTGIPSVAIEVQLPWLSSAQRAGYQKVSVEDYHPREDEHLRARRKRHGVSPVSSTVVDFVESSYSGGEGIGDRCFMLFRAFGGMDRGIVCQFQTSPQPSIDGSPSVMKLARSPQPKLLCPASPLSSPFRSCPVYAIRCPQPSNSHSLTCWAWISNARFTLQFTIYLSSFLNILVLLPCSPTFPATGLISRTRNCALFADFFLSRNQAFFNKISHLFVGFISPFLI